MWLAPDEALSLEDDGYGLVVPALLEVINLANARGLALVEAHNHGGADPRFSRTDRAGLKEFVPYVLDSLPKRPYAATVWGDYAIYGEFFSTDGSAGEIKSIVSTGTRLRQLASHGNGANHETEGRFDRQVPWFTAAGQEELSRFRVGIVGLGGTGWQVASQLAYLGVRDFLLVDGDAVGSSSLNRIATPADLGSPKVYVVGRSVRQIAPTSHVEVVPADLRSRAALDGLRNVDIIFGCVDNDGARLVLNELALAYRLPYFDLGVGLSIENGKLRAGGRVSFLNGSGPCLVCAGDIDPQEARYFLDPPDRRKEQRRAGYVQGLDEPAPSVASLNGLVANVAVNEFAVLVSGVRPVPSKVEFDLIGTGRPGPSCQWVYPVIVHPRNGCVECAKTGTADGCGIERYVTC